DGAELRSRCPGRGIAQRSRAMQIRFLALAIAGLVLACTNKPADPAPLADCEVQTDASMVCRLSFPGCTFHPDIATQFVYCGRRYEYVVYGRADNCPELYYFPEGTFLSPDDWRDYVGACERRPLAR